MWTSSSLHVQTRQHHPLGVSWLWSFTCHASNSELEGFGSVPESPAQTWGRSQWHSPMPLAGLVASGDTSPCTQKHKHTQLLSAWPGSSRLPPHLKVALQFDSCKCFSDSSQQGKCAIFWAGAAGGLQGSSGQPQGPSQAGAHRLCLEGQLRLCIALRASSQILQSYLTEPFCDPLASPRGGGSAAYIYIHVYISVWLCIYIYAQICVCISMCVCPVWGDAVRKSSI